MTHNQSKDYVVDAFKLLRFFFHLLVGDSPF
jgi:hypothetical protein